MWPQEVGHICQTMNNTATVIRIQVLIHPIPRQILRCQIPTKIYLQQQIPIGMESNRFEIIKDKVQAYCSPDDPSFRWLLEHVAYLDHVYGDNILEFYDVKQYIELSESDLRSLSTQDNSAHDLYTALLNKPLSGKGIYNVIVCNKCKKHGKTGVVQWHSRQTRSADEGTTIFCCCTTCNSRWKLSS